MCDARLREQIGKGRPGYVVVEENGGDESRSHKELAIHTACSADTTRCRTSYRHPGKRVPREFENVSISIYTYVTVAINNSHKCRSAS